MATVELKLYLSGDTGAGASQPSVNMHIVRLAFMNEPIVLQMFILS